MRKFTFKDYAASTTGRPQELVMTGDTVDGYLADDIAEADGDAWEGGLYLQAKHPWDVAAGQGIYETLARDAEGAPYKYLGRCTKGSRINLDPRKARRIFICSPLRSDTEEGLARNLALASAACLQAFREGYLPIAPHLYFPLFLPDAAPLSRWYGMQAGMMLMEGCEKVRVYRIGGTLSAGQLEEMHHATMHMAMQPEIIDMDEKELWEFLALAGQAAAGPGSAPEEARPTEEASDPEPAISLVPEG